MATKYPAIPNPAAEVHSLRSSAIALKETVEILTQQRGNRGGAAVTWQDLVNLGLILPSQVPITPSNS